MVEAKEKSLKCDVGELNKLLKVKNYYIWKLKMSAILKKDNPWNIIKAEISHIIPCNHSR